MFWNLLLGLALLIIGYLIMPKPKAPKPDAVQELEAPTADAGKQLGVVVGDITMKSPNFLWYGNIQNVRKTKKSNKK
jgi:hypothetical protein